jgi:hypothetical protein
MNDNMKQYATRFDFPTSGGISNTVVMERVLDFDGSYFWIIKLGGSRWSRKYQTFRYRDDQETVDEYEDDTKYSLDEAFAIASTRDLYKEHMKYINEPAIPSTYKVDSTVYELDKAYVREIGHNIKTNDELAKERSERLKGQGYQVFILIGTRGDMVFDAVYKVKVPQKTCQKVSKLI